MRNNNDKLYLMIIGALLLGLMTLWMFYDKQVNELEEIKRTLAPVDTVSISQTVDTIKVKDDFEIKRLKAKIEEFRMKTEALRAYQRDDLDQGKGNGRDDDKSLRKLYEKLGDKEWWDSLWTKDHGYTDSVGYGTYPTTKKATAEFDTTGNSTRVRGRVDYYDSPIEEFDVWLEFWTIRLDSLKVVETMKEVVVSPSLFQNELFPYTLIGWGLFLLTLAGSVLI